MSRLNACTCLHACVHVRACVHTWRASPTRPSCTRDACTSSSTNASCVCKPHVRKRRYVSFFVYKLGLFASYVCAFCWRLCPWSCTLGQDQFIFRHPNMHFPTSSGVSERASKQMNERNGARERSKQCGASKLMSGASERANARVSGTVLTCGFLVVLDHSAMVERSFIH